jgi:hypothetical protein
MGFAALISRSGWCRRVAFNLKEKDTCPQITQINTD